MARTGQEGIELRCGKCLRNGHSRGRLFDTVWLVNDRIHGIRVETDLLEQMKAERNGGGAYESPAWLGSTPYSNECRCGNAPKLKLETLTSLLREAASTGSAVIYL